MKLYSYYRSSTSYRVRIGLHLKGCMFDLLPVNLKHGAQQGADFAALTPYQTVPVLEGPDGRVMQSLAILDWLEDTYPSPSFLPGNRQADLLCKELYYALATETHAPNNLPVLQYLYAEFGADNHAIEQWYARWIHRTFHPIEQRLAAWRWMSPDLPFEHPGLMEIVLIPQIYNARRFQVDLTPFSNLERIDAHCRGLMPFQHAHPDAQPDAPEI